MGRFLTESCLQRPPYPQGRKESGGGRAHGVVGQDEGKHRQSSSSNKYCLLLWVLFFLWGEEPDCVTSIPLLGSRRCSCICPVPPLLDLACKCESLVGKFPWSLPWVADCNDERKIYIQCLTMVRNVFCCV